MSNPAPPSISNVASAPVTSSLLVTNDFPPKIGGIQSYLYELWRRLPASDTTVLTTPYANADAWDQAQPFRVERTRQRFLLPGSFARLAMSRWNALGSW